MKERSVASSVRHLVNDDSKASGVLVPRNKIHSSRIYLFKMVKRIEDSLRTTRGGTTFHIITVRKDYNASIGINQRLHSGPFSGY